MTDVVLPSEKNSYETVVYRPILCELRARNLSDRKHPRGGDAKHHLNMR